MDTELCCTGVRPSLIPAAACTTRFAPPLPGQSVLARGRFTHGAAQYLRIETPTRQAPVKVPPLDRTFTGTLAGTRLPCGSTSSWAPGSGWRQSRDKFCAIVPKCWGVAVSSGVHTHLVKRLAAGSLRTHDVYRPEMRGACPRSARVLGWLRSHVCTYMCVHTGGYTYACIHLCVCTRACLRARH